MTELSSVNASYDADFIKVFAGRDAEVKTPRPAAKLVIGED